jgi:methylglutaconyl-CoA hydratase
MMQFETITLDRDDRGVARLTLNRPARHNALNAAMIAELTEAARRIAADPAARVVVLAGQGKGFCAGADLEWMKQQFSASPDDRKLEATRLAEMFRCIDELPVFVIGVVEGAAYGGGVGLAAVCDLVIAAPGAQFALTETKLGLIPAAIGPYLHRRIGAAAMRRLALHGERFGATEAKAIGLVSHIAVEGEIAALVEHHVAQALTCAPGAIADAKRLFRRIESGQADESETIESLVRRWSTEEAQAGIAAFFTKEKAPWQR